MEHQRGKDNKSYQQCPLHKIARIRQVQAERHVMFCGTSIEGCFGGWLILPTMEIPLSLQDRNRRCRSGFTTKWGSFQIMQGKSAITYLTLSIRGDINEVLQTDSLTLRTLILPSTCPSNDKVWLVYETGWKPRTCLFLANFVLFFIT